MFLLLLTRLVSVTTQGAPGPWVFIYVLAHLIFPAHDWTSERVHNPLSSSTGHKRGHK